MRMLKAEIKNGIVYVDGKPVKDAVKLCEGKADSSGFFIIDKETFIYIAKTSQDLSSALDLLNNLISKISTGILASNGGGAITSPTFTADMQQLSQEVSQLKAKLT